MDKETLHTLFVVICLSILCLFYCIDVMWYSATVSHVYGTPDLGFGGGSMALPRVLGKGSSDPLPTLRINDLNLSCLLWLTVFLILPHPFQGWGNHYCPNWPLYIYYWCFYVMIIYSYPCNYCLLYITPVYLKPSIKWQLKVDVDHYLVKAREA